MPAARSDEFTFDNRTGDQLSGRLELPPGEPSHLAIFAHCFTCSKQSVAASRISKALAARGIGVLRFDFTGLGGSEGDFANTHFSSNVDDLAMAAAALTRRYRAPSLLVGHSLGGAAVLAVAPELPDVRAVATIGAPSDPAHVAQLFGDQAPTIDAEGRAEVHLGGRAFTIRKEFLEDLERHSLAERLPRLGKALLIFHAPRDEIVSIDHAAAIYSHARHPKSFISLDGANHLLTDPRDASYVADTLVAWAGRYLPETPTGTAEPLAAGHVRVEETGLGLQQRIRAGEHQLIADEPVAVGGHDTGPDPYGLLLASLGACTSMTLRLYARRKSWPVDRITVELAHSKIHARDCESCESETGMVDRIERVLHVEGDLDAEQRGRLLEIANRCPVHRTLMGEKEITARYRES